MSTRLSKTMRDDICANILAKTFNERETKIKKDRIVMADAIYKIEMPTDFVKAAAKLNERYFKRSASAKVCDKSDNGFTFPLSRSNHCEMSDVKPFPANYHSYGTFFLKAENPKSVELIDKQLNAERELLAEKEKMKSRVQGLLWSATTLEKLRAAAPELNDYLPEPEAKCTLPAIVVGTLVTDLMASGLKIPAPK